MTFDLSDIKSIGSEVSSRNMLFIYNDGQQEAAFLRIGKPFKLPEEQTWCCAFTLGTNSDNRLYPTVGIDSLQALDLTMKSLATIVAYWERSRKGKFHFLDEEGAGV